MPTRQAWRWVGMRRSCSCSPRFGPRSSWSAADAAPTRALAGALEQGAPAARADERLDGRALLLDDERLQVRLVAAMRADAVHARRLRVEPAHRHLAADRAGAGHAWSSGCDEQG